MPKVVAKNSINARDFFKNAKCSSNTANDLKEDALFRGLVFW